MAKRCDAFAALLALATIAALTSCGGSRATPSVAPSDRPISLHRVFVAGRDHNYRFTLSLQGDTFVQDAAASESSTVDGRLDVVERTISVDPAGTATIRYLVRNASMSVNGSPASLPPVSKLTVKATMTRNDTVASVVGVNGLGLGSSDLGPVTDLFGPTSLWPVLPEHAVRPGDAWGSTLAVPIPYLDRPLEITLRNTLIANKTLDGQRVAEIQSGDETPLDVRVSVRRLATTIEQATGQRPSAEDLPFPASAIFAYGGAEKTIITQIVHAATGQLIAADGTGSVHATLRVVGVSNPPPPITFDFTSTVSLRLLDPVADLPQPQPAGSGIQAARA